jgi:hypothetical protein
LQAHLAQILEHLSLKFELSSYCDEMTPDLHFGISISWLKVASAAGLTG